MATLLHPEKMDGVHDDLQEFARDIAEASVTDITICRGCTTASEQLEKWEQGRAIPGPHAGETGYPALGCTVTNAKALASTAHGREPGCAIDFGFIVDGQYVDADNDEHLALYTWLGEQAEIAGFRWGGRFQRKDYGHVEISGWQSFPLAT